MRWAAVPFILQGFRTSRRCFFYLGFADAGLCGRLPQWGVWCRPAVSTISLGGQGNDPLLVIEVKEGC